MALVRAAEPGFLIFVLGLGVIVQAAGADGLDTATLLWRRVLRAEGTDAELGEFLRLGALTVPTGLVAATVLLWLALNA